MSKYPFGTSADVGSLAGWRMRSHTGHEGLPEYLPDGKNWLWSSKLSLSVWLAHTSAFLPHGACGSPLEPSGFAERLPRMAKLAVVEQALPLRVAGAYVCIPSGWSARQPHGA